MGIRKQIKSYVFALVENFTQNYTNLKEDNYEKNLMAEKESQVTLLRQKRKKQLPQTVQPVFFTTINTKEVRFDSSVDNKLKKYTPFMFDVKLETALGPLNKAVRYRDNKVIKPAFLKNKSKLKKNKANNQHILSYDHHVVTISKKVLKYYVDYDRIVIDKKVLDEYIEK
jgi:hypothetical protein